MNVCHDCPLGKTSLPWDLLQPFLKSFRKKPSELCTAFEITKRVNFRPSAVIFYEFLSYCDRFPIPQSSSTLLSTLECCNKNGKCLRSITVPFKFVRTPEQRLKMSQRFTNSILVVKNCYTWTQYNVFKKEIKRKTVFVCLCLCACTREMDHSHIVCERVWVLVSVCVCLCVFGDRDERVQYE